MSDSKDNLLDYKGDKVQGKDLLDQSADLEGESLEYDSVVLEEEQQADPGLKLACDDNDIFDEDGITESQLVRATNAPTQEENPEGLDQSLEVVEIPPSEPMDGIESQQNAPLRDGQDIIGQEDSIPLQSRK